MGQGAKPSRAYLLACSAVALALVAACLWIASSEWFSRDDFAFLAHVRGDDFRWRDTFWPGGTRFWHFYRPLGMETYFRLCSRLFGLHAAGYFAVSLGFHFASGLLLLDVARRLGLDPRAAIAAALLAVSRPPALDEIFYGSVFHFVLSVFLTLLAADCFLRALSDGGRRWQAASLVALALALLTNAVNAVAPAVLLCAGLAARPPARAVSGRVLRAVVPHAALVAAYAALRLAWIPLVSERALYTPSPGPAMLSRAAGLLSLSFGGALGSAAALACAALLVGLAARGSDAMLPGVAVGSGGGPGALARLGWRALWLAGWAVAAVAPFALLPFPQPRYAMLAAPPLALLCGAVFDAAWRAQGARHPRPLEAVFVVAVLAAMPFAVLAERVQEPRGARPLALLRAVDAVRDELPPRARLVVLYGAPGLAGTEAAIAYRYLAYNGTVLQAAHPGTELSLRFHDLSQRPPRDVIRPGAVYLRLSPELEIGRASPVLLQRELPRAVAPARPGAGADERAAGAAPQVRAPGRSGREAGW
jgi:hypothetical protein